MNLSPLSSYVKLSRLVFNVEPSEVWEDCDEFEDELRGLYQSILCKNCGKLLIDPVVPKKHHFSCQHRVCLDCIGKKHSTPTNCQMCSDYTLFEKSHQTKLLLRCFQELCELVHTSWIHDYIQRRTNHDTGQKETPSLIEIIDAGMNYGRVSIVLDETSSDENSSSSDASKEPAFIVPFTSQIFPNISPLSPVKSIAGTVQSSASSSEQFTIISDPVIPIVVPTPPTEAASAVPQIVQYQPQIVQSQIPSTSKLTPNIQQPSYIRYPPPPMKIQTTFSSPPTPTIYSVMYTGSGNKITLKRKPPDESLAVAPVTTNSNNVSSVEMF
jgi:zinc RING finger of MSL2